MIIGTTSGQNIRAEVITEALFKEALIYTEDYYARLNKAINEISKVCNMDVSESYKFIVSSLGDLKETLAKAPHDDISAAASFLNLFMMPLLDSSLAQKSKYLQGKTYKSFNIDLAFFASLRKENYVNYYINQNASYVIYLDAFEFRRSRLSKFILSRKNGMKWRYNSKYQLKSVTFLDGIEVKL
jgi:hypothetical protein